MEKVLITGSCGFIGMHLACSLIDDGYEVLGLDNLNNYYDISLKQNRLKKLKQLKNFSFTKTDIIDKEGLEKVFRNFKPHKVVNLAAQAGVRYSLENPNAYIESNVLGFMNILECCRYHKTKGLMYASSSSVYGGNKKTPFSVDDIVDSPISIYAASKKANELMAYTYSHLYGINTTGFRFFTVYGPWGRPDMAMYIFTKKIIQGEPIPVFNNGNMKRDFTFIDDIISGIRSGIEKNYKSEIFNLGNSSSINLMDMISLIEQYLGKKAIIHFKGMQLGDVKATSADIQYSREKLNFNPSTSINDGIEKFVDWYKFYIKSR